MSILIYMKDVHKRYSTRPVLTGFDLTVQQGEILGVLGPSGVGKSTLLRMIAGIEAQDSGVVDVRTTRLGYVFQEPRLLPWDTVLSNVSLPLRAQGMQKKQAQELASSYLVRMGLGEFETAFPHQLSGGMRQRVALARAFAISPDILLLDEPFTGLDQVLVQTMKELLEACLVNKQTAVIHVTHDRTELLDQTNRLIQLTPQIGAA